jgi:hypothetical protein
MNGCDLSDKESVMIRMFTPGPEPKQPRPCPEHGADKWYACCAYCYDLHMPRNLADARDGGVPVRTPA